jgi:hypothetical protein
MSPHYCVRGDTKDVDGKIAEVQAAGCGEGDVKILLVLARASGKCRRLANWRQRKSAPRVFAGTSKRSDYEVID